MTLFLIYRLPHRDCSNFLFVHFVCDLLWDRCLLEGEGVRGRREGERGGGVCVNSVPCTVSNTSPDYTQSIKLRRTDI